MNKNYLSDHIESKQAWVVFSGQTDLPWLKCLKPGYRHCYVLLNDGRYWISVDPLFPHTEIIVHHVPADFDLPAWLRGRGYESIKCPVIRSLKKPAPLSLFTCVEAVKRIIGIHSWRIHTPWQLYKYLRKHSQSKPVCPSQQHKENYNGRINIRTQSAPTAANRLRAASIAADPA